MSWRASCLLSKFTVHSPYSRAARIPNNRHGARSGMVLQPVAMATRIVPDHDKPSVAIEISLEKPLPDYDLCEMDQPSPRDVDGVLVSQGFRDLVDDARGVLMEIISEPPPDPASSREIT